ncbi:MULTISPECIES: M20/M25/M40 family metallo-hydrolase [unclassified Sphingomonas]|uniref:M20/M25/M40 family metallo-hydrolase n=1 Tax=unclassified Sphingomonas TaxID=196159 RepID=UPI000926EF2C|nr:MULTISPECIES: M20/M25/M40 family metallo-hydrolase [unclassified Sphingomonas]OJU22225.1 MAG: peptidase M28 [Sphingomonas sp. 66-10]
MNRTLLPLTALLLATPAAAREAPSPEKLRASVEKLVSFGTRHSLSSATDPKRGIGAARNWVAAEFASLSKQCGGCISVERLSRRFTGPRARDGVVIEDVLGIQKGSDPNRFVIVGGHIDSRVSNVMDITSDAPGANDDASGVALVLEAARILSKEKFAANIVYVAFSGEEQGLWGATLLAETAKARGWQVDAMLNNDIVGNSIGQGGVRAGDYVRVFSEGIRTSETLAEQVERRAIGGEDDGPSRALAKTIHGIAQALPGDFAAFVDRRPDRFGRGGDHEPFLREGYPAVRFTVAAENWDRQHQDLRTENGIVYGDTIEGMDFAYLSKVTAINVATLARLAAAPAAPAGVSIAGALGRDTNVKWSAAPGATGYRLHWRRADQQDWSDQREVAGGVTTAVLKDVPVDDHFVGVSAIGANGAESLISFAGRAAAK